MTGLAGLALENSEALAWQVCKEWMAWTRELDEAHLGSRVHLQRAGCWPPDHCYEDVRPPMQTGWPAEEGWESEWMGGWLWSSPASPTVSAFTGLRPCELGLWGKQGSAKVYPTNLGASGLGDLSPSSFQCAYHLRLETPRRPRGKDRRDKCFIGREREPGLVREEMSWGEGGSQTMRGGVKSATMVGECSWISKGNSGKVGKIHAWELPQPKSEGAGEFVPTDPRLRVPRRDDNPQVLSAAHADGQSGF